MSMVVDYQFNKLDVLMAKISIYH